MKNCEHTYDFAKALFNIIVDRSDSKVELFDSWDPVGKQICEENEEDYFLDPEHLQENSFNHIDYNERDSSTFRLYWKYIPQFRVLDKADFVKTRVFVTPAIIGTTLIFAFYMMIMFFNDNRLSVEEIAGVAICVILVFIISAIFYGIYRFTLKKV